MDKNNEIVKELNSFLKGINMGYETFESYEKKLKDTKLKSEFANILSKFNSQKDVVISYIENLNGDPKDSLGIAGEIASMYEKLKDIFMDTDKEILHNSIKGIDMGIQQSEKVIISLENISADNSMITSLKAMVEEYRSISNNLNNLYNNCSK